MQNIECIIETRSRLRIHLEQINASVNFVISEVTQVTIFPLHLVTIRDATKGRSKKKKKTQENRHYTRDKPNKKQRNQLPFP